VLILELSFGSLCLRALLKKPTMGYTWLLLLFLLWPSTLALGVRIIIEHLTSQENQIPSCGLAIHRQGEQTQY
jgi:hypothetical protein